MEVMILLIFVSLMLVILAVGFFLWNIRVRSHHYTDRLALLPLDEPLETDTMEKKNERNPQPHHV